MTFSRVGNRYPSFTAMVRFSQMVTATARPAPSAVSLGADPVSPPFENPGWTRSAALESMVASPDPCPRSVHTGSVSSPSMRVSLSHPFSILVTVGIEDCVAEFNAGTNSRILQLDLDPSNPEGCETTPTNNHTKRRQEKHIWLIQPSRRSSTA
jgi:hypothetical protein